MLNISPPGGRLITAMAMLLLGLAGCARDRYQFGSAGSDEPLKGPAIQILVDDRPHPGMDKLEQKLHGTIARIASVFGKDPLSAAEQEKQRAEAASLVTSYLQQNGLHSVFVEQRTYQPDEQWRRLRDNETMLPVWKVTAGSLSILRTTLLPPRLFRRDHYNPFTRTLSLNSLEPTSALRAASEVRLYQESRTPGWRGFSRYLPLVPTFHEIQIANETLSYSRAIDDSGLTAQLYTETYGLIGASAVSEVLPFAEIGRRQYALIARITGRVIGRGVGRIMGEINTR